MTTKTIFGALAVASLAIGVAPRLRAQSMSTLTHAKSAASNAVAATNEHTDREQMVGAASAAPAKEKSGTAAPASASSAAPAAAKAKPAAKTPAAPAHDADAKSGAPAKAAAAAPAAPTAAKPAARPDESPAKGAEKEITLFRESFSYSADGRRDPFVSLIANGDLRPMISDLRLVTVIYAPEGRSVAIMRDVSTQEQYRVKAGQTLGRMRVAQIAPKSVTFTIEEYGFSRQEVLALNDTTRARSQ